MIKKITIFLSIFAIMFTCCCCTKTSVSDLKYYVVSRSAINDGMSDSEIVNNAKNKGRLVFSGEDIVGYNWQTHTLTLKEKSVPSIATVTKDSGGSAIFKVDDTYAFVLTIGNKLIYTGGFESGTKNPAIPLQPYIKDESRYSFSLQFDSKYADFSDNRSNKKLYEFLNSNGLLSSKIK